MCGRFVRHSNVHELTRLLGADWPGADPAPSYNVAPGQQVLAVRGDADREAVLLRWGLVPGWAREPAVGYRMINARAESVADKPAYRAAFKRRRCLIPADGFYEWRAEAGGKQPYYIHRRDGQPLAFAGLWEHWDKGEAPLETCTIITTTANADLTGLHDRMPVILEPSDWEAWLHDGQNPLLLESLLRPLPDGELTLRRVSREVNKPVHDGPQLIAPQGDLFD